MFGAATNPVFAQDYAFGNKVRGAVLLQKSKAMILRLERRTGSEHDLHHLDCSMLVIG